MGRCPKPAIHPGEKSSCWEVEWCWNSYQVVVSGHQSMDSIFYITLPLAIRNRCFSTPFLLAAGCGEGAFSLKSLLKNHFKAVEFWSSGKELHYPAPLLPLEGHHWTEKNRPVYPSCSCSAPAVWVLLLGPELLIFSLPLLWIISVFISRINGCFLLHSLGKPASLKISKRTPHSSPLCFHRCKFEMTIKKENQRKK